MDRGNKRQSNDLGSSSEAAVQGLPSKDVDAVPASGGTPVENKKDTSELDTLFKKLR